MKWDFFIYEKEERWGIAFLALLCLVLFFISFLYTTPAYRLSEAELEAVRAQLRDTVQAPILAVRQDSNLTIDLNTIGYKELCQLGFAPLTARKMLAYRRKAGFLTVEMLTPKFGADTALVRQLRPYIQVRRPRERRGRPVRDSLFVFDPNEVSADALRRLGFPARAVKALLAYRKKNGRFRTARDLKKIYGVSDALYARIAPYVRIQGTGPELARDTVRRPVRKPVYRPRVIEVNSATIADWDQLPGIGPYWAGRIVRWRDKLGGFYRISQVGDTYGLPDSTYRKIRVYLTVDTTAVRKIVLGKASFKDIVRHPYINYEETKALVRSYQAGLIQDVDDIASLDIFSAGRWARVRPYLAVEPPF